MKEQIRLRLQDLKKEMAAGQEVLAELETKKLDTRNTMIRISGAIQVLEDLLRQSPDEDRIKNDREEPAGRRVATG